MNRILLKLILVLAAGILGFGGMAHAQSSDNDHCSNHTLNGDYAFKLYGQIWVPPIPPNTNVTVVLRDGVAMTHFDGDGSLTQVDYVMGNGIPDPGQPDPITGFHINETGTYQVNSDCTGQAEIDLPPPPGMSSGAVIKLMFVLGENGKIIHTIVSELIPPGATAGIPVQIHSDGERLRRN